MTGRCLNTPSLLVDRSGYLLGIAENIDYIGKNLSVKT
jgi:hypothetical protein